MATTAALWRGSLLGATTRPSVAYVLSQSAGGGGWRVPPASAMYSAFRRLRPSQHVFSQRHFPQLDSFGKKKSRYQSGALISTVTCSAEGANTSSSSDDALLSYLSKGKEVSVLSIVGTRLVQDMAQRHKTSPTATAALGRALMGTLLLQAAKGQKGMTVQVTWRGNGPLGQMMTVADGTGQVKGFVANPACNPPPKNGKLDVAAAVGEGVLAVVLNHPSYEVPFTGMVPIHTGEVAEDIAMYLADSEQVNSAIGLGVLVKGDGSVTGAGGWMIQVLPNASEETLSILERNVGSLPSSSQMAAEGWSPERIVGALLEGIGVEDKLVEMTPSYGPCGLEHLKPRMLRAVASLGKEELEQARREEGKLEVVCEFCREAVEFGEDELGELIAKFDSTSLAEGVEESR